MARTVPNWKTLGKKRIVIGKRAVELDLRQNDAIWAGIGRFDQSRVSGIGYRL